MLLRFIRQNKLLFRVTVIAYSNHFREVTFWRFGKSETLYKGGGTREAHEVRHVLSLEERAKYCENGGLKGKNPMQTLRSYPLSHRHAEENH